MDDFYYEDKWKKYWIFKKDYVENNKKIICKSYKILDTLKTYFMEHINTNTYYFEDVFNLMNIDNNFKYNRSKINLAYKILNDFKDKFIEILDITDKNKYNFEDIYYLTFNIVDYESFKYNINK